MIKFLASIGLILLASNEAQAYDQGYDDYREPPRREYREYREFNDYRPRPMRGPRRHQRQAYDRTVSNYFKASMGWSSVSEHEDFSGTLTFDDSIILPMHLGYGFTAGNAAFEAELGFSTNQFDFTPFDPSEFGGFGDMASSKLMFNGFYKTNATGTNLYIGGGVGLASVTMDGIEDELNGTAFAAQFIIGGEIRTSQRSGLFVEYKHLKTVGLELENDFAIFDYDFEEGSLNIGVKLYF